MHIASPLYISVLPNVEFEVLRLSENVEERAAFGARPATDYLSTAKCLGGTSRDRLSVSMSHRLYGWLWVSQVRITRTLGLRR